MVLIYFDFTKFLKMVVLMSIWFVLVHWKKLLIALNCNQNLERNVLGIDGWDLIITFSLTTSVKYP